MAYQRKTRDEWQVWSNYACGWEEVTAAETCREIRDLLKDYRENEPQYQHKIKCVRVPIESEAS